MQAWSRDGVELESQAGSPVTASSRDLSSWSGPHAGCPAVTSSGEQSSGTDTEEEDGETNLLDLVYEAVAELDQSVGWIDVELVIAAVQELFEEEDVLESIDCWVDLGVFLVRRHVSLQVKFAVTPIRTSK